MKKLLALCLITISCAKDVDDLGFRTYIIPEGEHRSGNFFNHPVNSRINFKFILDESAEYTTEIAENQYDVNKIYGFSDFGKAHQKYSIRLGWRYVEGNVELCWLKRENSSMSSDGFWGAIRRYYLYPYFGGNEFAPHDITIKIKE